MPDITTGAVQGYIGQRQGVPLAATALAPRRTAGHSISSGTEIANAYSASRSVV